ncbi:Sir2 family NAD-dependent protein deacetylase [Methanococcoides vulcani]|uniref:Sir2 family NAD-dependent protein deacetylase n=1 Tax=Methanococcoides vulcani TaxID=1353158 RepID=UPI0024533CE3|nr:Sir2 family NAD-dependent protein deacetylase [Methanococcoides vulcani]
MSPAPMALPLRLSRDSKSYFSGIAFEALSSTGAGDSQGTEITVYTQNIDMLHQKAGSKNVIEIHGSPEYHTCLSCGTKYPFFDMIAEIVKEGEIPGL